MGIAPRRITTTGFETGHIDCVLNSKAQSIQWTAIGRRQIATRYKGVTLSNSDLGAVHSLTLPQRDQSAITLQAMTTYKPSEKNITAEKPSLLAALIFRRARLAPSDNHRNHGTTGPCFSSPGFPDRFHGWDLQYRRRPSSNERAPFAASPYPVDEMTCDQSFPAMAAL